MTGALIAPTLSADTIYSGATNLYNLFVPISYYNLPVTLGFALSDETTAITTGTDKLTFYMPHGMTLSEVRGCLSTSGSTQTTVNINQTGTTIFSTKLTIDSYLSTSKDSATQPVITGSTLYDNTKITFDIDGAGTAAKGLKVFLIGNKL
jgi:hypothetical protein